MKTSEVEEALGINKQTILFYEKEGLLNPNRDENGYRNYSDEDVQTLQVIKFLRGMNVPISDVRQVLEGKLTLQACLDSQRESIKDTIQELEDIKKKVMLLKEKDLPLIPALTTLSLDKTNVKIGFKKTTKRVSIGRRIRKEQIQKQMVYSIVMVIILVLSTVYGINKIIGYMPSIFYIALVAVLYISVFIIMVGLGTQITAFTIVEQFRFLEFSETGIEYYYNRGMRSHFKYVYSIVCGKDDAYISKVTYEDIDYVVVHCVKRYIKIPMTNVYTDMYMADFTLHFKNEETLFISSSMILENDSILIGEILKEKVKNIVDRDNVLDAYQKGINLTEYMQNK